MSTWTALFLAVVMAVAGAHAHHPGLGPHNYGAFPDDLERNCTIAISSTLGSKLQQRKNLKICLNRLDEDMDALMDELREASGNCGKCGGKTRPFCDEYCVKGLLHFGGFFEEIFNLSQCLAVENGLVKDSVVDMEVLKASILEKVRQKDERMVDWTKLGFENCIPVQNFEVLPYLQCVSGFCTTGSSLY